MFEDREDQVNFQAEIPPRHSIYKQPHGLIDISAGAATHATTLTDCNTTDSFSLIFTVLKNKSLVCFSEVAQKDV